MRIKISGFSKGTYGNLGDKVWVLVAGGKDIILRAGDEIEIIRPTKRAADAIESAAEIESDALKGSADEQTYKPRR